MTDEALLKMSYATPRRGCMSLKSGGWSPTGLFHLTCSYRSPARTVSLLIGFHSSCAKYAYDFEPTEWFGFSGLTLRTVRPELGTVVMLTEQLVPEGKP